MKTIAALLVAAATLGLAPAFAEDVEFSFAASELSSTADVAELYDRMEDRAFRACALYQSSGLFAVEYQRRCAEGLVDQFVAEIDDSRLSALHEEREPRFAENRWRRRG